MCRLCRDVKLIFNIPVFQTDTLLTYRPYLDLLTGSEFFTFLVGAHSGKATFASFLLIWSSVSHMCNNCK